MATYIPGVTDSGFNPVQYSPNLPYLTNALQKATARYEKGYDEISTAYSKVANGLLSSPDNVAFRQKFLDETKNALKTISAQDLSIPQNVDQAERLFSPLWEDEDFLTDYTKSKQYQQELSRYEKLRTSTKKEDRDQAWQEGASYIDLFRKEMALTKRGDGSIKNVQVRPFIPYVDVNSEITKELKNLGYGEGIVKVKVADGYITTVTNGKGTYALFEDVLNQILKSRSDLMSVFKVQGVTQFQSSVFNIMSENPALSREDAERRAKQNYATEKINLYDKQLQIYNKQFNGDDQSLGIKNEWEQIKERVESRLAAGEITTNDPEYKRYSEKFSSYLGLKNQIKNYETKINNLKSNDFYETRGEDYFTESYKDFFVQGNARMREAAITEKVVQDPTFNAAQRNELSQLKQEMDWLKFQMLYNQDNNQFEATYRARYGTNPPNQKNTIGEDFEFSDAANAPITKKGRKTEDLTPEELDIPTVGAVYGQTKDLERSAYTNFESNLNQERFNYIGYTSESLNKSGLFTSIPYISDYIDYLTHYASGGLKNQKYFKESNIKEAYTALKNAKMIKDDITTYNQSPSIQLNQLLDYAKNSVTTQTPEFVDFITAAETASRNFIEYSSINDDFNKSYSKKAPGLQYSTVVKKDKNGNYKLIDAEYISNYLNDYNKKNNIKAVNFPLNLSQLYLNGSLPITTELLSLNTGTKSYKSGFVTATRTGSLVPNKYFTKYNGVTYDITPLTIQFGSPENVIEQIKKYETNRSESFSKYVASKGGSTSDDWIMNRTLKYKNNAEDQYDQKAFRIAAAVFEDEGNRGNIIPKSGGVIKPANWDQLLSNGADEDELIKYLKTLGNQALLNNVLENSYLSFAGTTSDKSNVRLEFNIEKMKLFTDGKSSPIANATLNALSAYGLSYDINKETFKKFARDSYMQSVVTENILKRGLRASDYEKNSLFYDYEITKGAGGSIVARYKVKKYDVDERTFLESEEWVTETFKPEIGVDNVLKLIRSKMLPNTFAIMSYLKKQKEMDLQNQKTNLQSPSSSPKQIPTIKGSNESFEDWRIRMKQEGYLFDYN